MSDAERAKSLIRLTKRELECLQLAARPMRSKEIASELGISVKTVESYLDAARIKLNASTRTAAIRMFRAAEEPPVSSPGEKDRLVIRPDQPPPTSSIDEAVVPANRVQEPSALMSVEPAALSLDLNLPIRRRSRLNDLTTSNRLFWIAAISVAAALATALMWLAIAAAGWAIRQPN